MSGMSGFSVIVPNYNHAAFLKERIDSIIGQTVSPVEIIILDDASTDNSREIIESYRENPLVKHIIYNDTNSGSPFIQWAHGIRAAKAEWIWIAETDDRAKDDFLENASDFISKNPAAGIFYCDSFCEVTGTKAPPYKTYASAKNKFFKTEKWSAHYFIEGLLEVNESMKWFCTINNSSAALFRKDLLLDILNKLETFIYHGDWYCELALACRAPVIYHSKPMNYFRIHPGSFLAHTNKLQSKLECFRILSFLYENEFVTEKKKLIDFFTLQYLGYGFFSDGFKFGKNLFRSYKAINPLLSKKVFRSLVRQKLTGKKHKSIF